MRVLSNQARRACCRRSADGNAYPLDIPWGNTGSSMNAICMAALYHKYGFDEMDQPKMKAARCFMQRQLGFVTNHKCERSNATCATKGKAGFSYIVGYALTSLC
jgi:hypothetical protein